MNNKILLHRIINYCIAAVWLINGLICKVLNLVSRHQQIVARIAGNEHAAVLTKAIGLSEILMALWVIGSFKSKFCAIMQMVIVAAMNIIEFFLVPDLLLFGKINSLVALFFIAVIYFNEFLLGKETVQQV